MIIVSTSDHHRSGDRAVSNFTEEKLYPKFIDACIRSKVDMHVKNGDIYELLQGGKKSKRLKAAQQVLHRVEKADAKARLYMQSIQIAGNHDMALAKKWNLPLEYIVQADGMRIYFTHGHIFDTIWKSKTWSIVGTAATEFWGYVEKKMGKDRSEKALNWMESLLVNKREPARGLGEDPYIKELVRKCKSINCQVGVMGHTHDECNYWNKDAEVDIIITGSLIHNTFPYAFIDTNRRIVKLRCYEGERLI